MRGGGAHGVEVGAGHEDGDEADREHGAADEVGHAGRLAGEGRVGVCVVGEVTLHQVGEQRAERDVRPSPERATPAGKVGAGLGWWWGEVG